MTPSATLIRNQLQDWARRRSIHIDSAGYTESLEDNFFVRLSDETLAELAAGDGSELGKPGRRGKIQALHSSSALACNVFEYWRGRDAAALAHVFGVTEGIRSIDFERKFPIGLRGSAPNLDVVFVSPSGLVTAIECKFLEPYGSHHTRFKPKYFESEPGFWRTAGFPRCQTLAEQLYSGELKYRWLNAEQLLKHILGLQRGPHEQWALQYLWYEVPGVVSDEHASEAEAFASVAVSDGIDFCVLSYQSVYRALETYVSESDRDYLAYLGDRYFAKLDQSAD